jgi:hypothetical protein
MTKAKLLAAGIILLMIGFFSGFVLRPVMLSPLRSEVAFAAPSSTATQNEARGVQYFETNIDEAFRVAAACREGTVRGDECVNAETAIVTVESKERFRRFREDR